MTEEVGSNRKLSKPEAYFALALRVLVKGRNSTTAQVEVDEAMDRKLEQHRSRHKGECQECMDKLAKVLERMHQRESQTHICVPPIIGSSSAMAVVMASSPATICSRSATSF